MTPYTLREYAQDIAAGLCIVGFTPFAWVINYGGAF